MYTSLTLTYGIYDEMNRKVRKFPPLNTWFTAMSAQSTPSLDDTLVRMKYFWVLVEVYNKKRL